MIERTRGEVTRGDNEMRKGKRAGKKQYTIEWRQDETRHRETTRREEARDETKRDEKKTRCDERRKENS